MAAEQLSKVRLCLIESVNVAALNDLIDCLRAKYPPVLSNREANQIQQGHQVTEDKTGLLVDMVSKKGNNASTHLFDILKLRHLDIFQGLPLDQAVDRNSYENQLSKVRKILIDRVNDALLKDLIDWLRDANPPVLTVREANEIMQSRLVTEDRVGQLIDLMLKKGDTSSAIMLSVLELRDKNLAEDIGLI
ncbi:hypothetical protein C0J50_14079 [Silurus asotus]|uniref:CARD domain-containing protein n=1 Tax=Silurus asotus TaxID=30991 RepID=A0AAD5FS79_SILAS|nr:hypothetical protein C0J50_14079 [Silurus asotus]